jgi:cell division septation protein DedD
MKHAIVSTLVVLVAVSACNRDKPADAPQQQAAAPTPPLRDTTPPSATKTPASSAAGTGAPASSPTGTKAPAQPASVGRAGGASSELASARRVFTVQVAAYLNAATAQSQRARLERAGVPVWTATATVGGQDFTRVRVGATTTLEEARALADKLRTTYHWPVWITTVENRTALPADALSATRTYAGVP